MINIEKNEQIDAKNMFNIKNTGNGNDSSEGR